MSSVVTVVGARPQFVKCAALRAAIRRDGALREVLVHTGQHYDFAMSEVFFQELDIPAPEHFLGIGGKSHGAMTGEMLAAIEGVLLEERPDAVVVYGDTNSTLAGALAAAKLHVPVLHVEAGLRSFNKRMPEEVNRVLTDHVSALLFCPTADAVANLAREGIEDGVRHVGDIMYDVTRSVLDRIDRDGARARHGDGTRPIATCTIHRAETTADPDRLRAVVDHVRGFADRYRVVLPLHPGTAAKVEAAGVDLSGLHVVPPLPYLELQALLAVSELVLTDSGGMQKEAYFHGVPCITLRDETEWVETVEAGWNRLWTEADWRPRKPIADYGEGDAAERILADTKAFLGL